MRSIGMAALLSLLTCSVTAWAEPAEEQAGEPFDAALAEELGADAYGMRRYVIVLLKAGNQEALEPERAAELQRGHLDNIRSLAEQGHLVVAGPFLDGGERRGLFVFAVDTVEAAQALTASDPLIESGRLKAEYWPWYGSAALMKVGALHERIARETP